MTLLRTEGFDWLQTSNLPTAYGALGTWAGGHTVTKSIVSGRSGNALRIAVTAGANNYLTDLTGSSLSPEGLAAGATCIIGFAVRFPTVNTTENLAFFGIDNGSGSKNTSWNLILARTSSGTIIAGHSTASNLNTLSVLYGTSSATIAANTWAYIEIKFAPHASAGTCILKINGVQQFSYSNDTMNNNTNYNNFVLGGIYADDINPIIEFDDVYICDTTGSQNNDFLGDVAVQTLKPNGNGTTSNFTGSDADSTDNYLHVDEDYSDDDTSYVEDNTTNNKDTYAYANTSNVNTVKAVNVKTIAKKTGAGGADLKAVARSSTTESDSSALGFSVDYTVKQAIYELDPNTASAWTDTTVDAAEFGIKVA